MMTTQGVNNKNPHNLRNGYVCYVCCEVQRDSKIVRVEGDEEADYYTLSWAYAVSMISRRGLRLVAELDDYLMDPDEDMDEMLELLDERKIISM